MVVLSDLSSMARRESDNPLYDVADKDASHYDVAKPPNSLAYNALYSKRDSSVRIRSQIDSRDHSGVPKWLFGLVTVLAIVGTILGVVSLSLLLTGGTCSSCNKERRRTMISLEMLWSSLGDDAADPTQAALKGPTRKTPLTVFSSSPQTLNVRCCLYQLRIHVPLLYRTWNWKIVLK